MIIHHDFITETDEQESVEHIKNALAKIRERKAALRNRIRRWGWDYEQPTRWLGDIPEWVPWATGGASWRLILGGAGLGDDKPDSVVVNEYLCGQRIAPHIDSLMFGDVAILNLCSNTTMRFTSPAGEIRDFVLPRRSLAVMSGPLRQTWTHETLPLKDDLRYSIVYRKRLA